MHTRFTLFFLIEGDDRYSITLEKSAHTAGPQVHVHAKLFD